MTLQTEEPLTGWRNVGACVLYVLLAPLLLLVAYVFDAVVLMAAGDEEES